MSYQIGVNVWIDDDLTVEPDLKNGWITVNYPSADVSIFLPSEWDEGGEQLVELRDALIAAVRHVRNKPDDVDREPQTRFWSGPDGRSLVANLTHEGVVLDAYAIDEDGNDFQVATMGATWEEWFEFLDERGDDDS